MQLILLANECFDIMIVGSASMLYVETHMPMGRQRSKIRDHWHRLPAHFSPLHNYSNVSASSPKLITQHEMCRHPHSHDYLQTRELALEIERMGQAQRYSMWPKSLAACLQ